MLRVLTLALVLTGTAAAAEPEIDVPSALDDAMPEHEQRALFARIETRVRDLAARGETPLLIFDIDDTLRLVKNKKIVAGAIAFVYRMKRAGATIVYLSHRLGVRDGEDLTPRTREQLRNLGFPAEDEAILLSPLERYTSAEWKGLAVEAHLPPGIPVAHFENDKPVMRRLRQVHRPGVEVVRMASLLDVTSQKDPTPGLGKGGIHVIRDFRHGVTWGERLKSRIPILRGRLFRR